MSGALSTHSTFRNPAATAAPAKIEWPTLAVAATIYSAFAAITFWHELLPLWILVPCAAYVVAWHSSLQHEVAHGHPTPWRWVNRLLVLPNLWLWIPFEIYRDSHLVHHRDENLTLPGVDPESYYFDPVEHANQPGWRRRWRALLNSILGRLLLSPLRCFWRTWSGGITDILSGDRVALGRWSFHILGAGLPLLWATQVAGIAWWEYLLYFAYAGTCLALLRSFLEHQAAPEVAKRTVIIEAEAPFALLFLNNNLHSVHHEHPGLAWYRLPARYRAQKQRYLALNGGYFFAGYLPVLWRYFVKAKEQPAHPGFLTHDPQPELEAARPHPARPLGGLRQDA